WVLSVYDRLCPSLAVRRSPSKQRVGGLAGWERAIRDPPSTAGLHLRRGKPRETGLPRKPWELWLVGPGSVLAGGRKVDARGQGQVAGAQAVGLLGRQGERDHDLLAAGSGDEVEVLQHLVAVQLAECRNPIDPAAAIGRHLACLKFLFDVPAGRFGHGFAEVIGRQMLSFVRTRPG